MAHLKLMLALNFLKDLDNANLVDHEKMKGLHNLSAFEPVTQNIFHESMTRFFGFANGTESNLMVCSHFML